MVSSATRNGMRVIAVVLNGGPMFEDCARLMDRAFAEYELCRLTPEESACSVKVTDGKTDSVRACGTESFSYPLRADEKEKIRVVSKPTAELHAPVKKGQEAGIFQIYSENQLLFEGKLYTMDTVPARDIGDKIKDIVDAW